MNRYLAFGFGDLGRAAYYNMTALSIFNKLKVRGPTCPLVALTKCKLLTVARIHTGIRF
jgi:hypothetical protein